MRGHDYIKTVTETIDRAWNTQQEQLTAAKTLIAEGKNLEDISRSVGFTDYSSFYRAFKKEYGITPRRYTQL